jgi:hypothetical protein
MDSESSDLQKIVHHVAELAVEEELTWGHLDLENATFIKTKIDTERDLYDAVEAQLVTFGLEGLYKPDGSELTTTKDWAAFVLSSMDQTYELINGKFPVTFDRVYEAVRQVRNEYRQQQFSTLVNNLYMALDGKDKEDLAYSRNPADVLRKDYGFYIEKEDEPDIEVIIRAKIANPDDEVTTEVIEEAEESVAWIQQAGKFGKPIKNAAEDLKMLIANLQGNLYSPQTGTIIGGNEAYSGKRVDGLKNPSARIDTQKPPRQGIYNVQYQIKGASQAGVIFTDDDGPAKVLEMLSNSLEDEVIYVSPSADRMRQKS